MTIRCLNCHREFDSIEDYHRHNSGHLIDEGVSMKPAPANGSAFR